MLNSNQNQESHIFNDNVATASLNRMKQLATKKKWTNRCFLFVLVFTAIIMITIKSSNRSHSVCENKELLCTETTMKVGASCYIWTNNVGNQKTLVNITKELGQGSSGKVLLAKSESESKMFALKYQDLSICMCSKDSAFKACDSDTKNQNIIAEMTRQYRAMKKLNSLKVHVPQVLSLMHGTSNYKHIMVMEYIDNVVELESGLKNRDITFADKSYQQCVQDTTQTVDIALAHDILHGDIKPQNILVEYNPTSSGVSIKEPKHCWIIDWGGYTAADVQSLLNGSTPLITTKYYDYDFTVDLLDKAYNNTCKKSLRNNGKIYLIIKHGNNHLTIGHYQSYKAFKDKNNYNKYKFWIDWKLWKYGLVLPEDQVFQKVALISQTMIQDNRQIKESFFYDPSFQKFKQLFAKNYQSMPPKCRQMINGSLSYPHT